MIEFFYNFHGFNQEIFLLFNKITNIHILPYILQIISFCFNITNFIIIYIIYCIFYYIQLQKIHNIDCAHEYFWRQYNKITEIGIIFAVFGVIFTILKFSVNFPRPFCSLPLDSFITIANIQNERCFSSFPSSHIGLAFLVTYFVWPYINMWLKIIMVILVALTGTARLSLAMHYPADLIYGILITILAIIIGTKIYKKLSDNLIKSIGDILVRFLITK